MGLSPPDLPPNFAHIIVRYHHLVKSHTGTVAAPTPAIGSIPSPIKSGYVSTVICVSCTLSMSPKILLVYPTSPSSAGIAPQSKVAVPARVIVETLQTASVIVAPSPIQPAATVLFADPTRFCM